MCIIAIKPKNKELFNDDLLKNMFDNNPDGAGYMFYDTKKKTVIIRKGFMTLKALKKALKKEGNLKKTNLVMHFRIGTSGKMDKFNCHPYPVFEKNGLDVHTPLGVAHNGILSAYTPTKTSAINDTQVFIRNVLSKLSKNFLNEYNSRTLIEELIGTNKLAFLDNANTVHTIGNFVEHDGYMFSNTSYEKRTFSYTPSWSKGWSKYDYLWQDDYKDDFYDSEYDNEYFKDILGEKLHKKCVKDFGEDYYETNEFWDWFDEKGK